MEKVEEKGDRSSYNFLAYKESHAKKYFNTLNNESFQLYFLSVG